MFNNMSIAHAAHAKESCGRQPPVALSFSSSTHDSQANAIGEHLNTLRKAKTTEEVRVNTMLIPVAIMWLLESDVRRHTRSIETLNRQEQAISAMSVI